MCQGKLLHLELESPLHSHRKCLRKGHYSSVLSMVQTHTWVNAAAAVFLRHAFQHLAAQPASPCFRNQCWVSDGKRVRNRTSPVTQVPLPPPKMPRASGKMTYSFDFWFTHSFSTTLKTRKLQQDTGMLHHFTWTDADVTGQQRLCGPDLTLSEDNRGWSPCSVEKEMETHSNTWKIPRTEESGGLYSPWGGKGSDTT